MLSLALILIASYFTHSSAQRNVTFDDDDPAIIYNGSWSVSASNFDVGDHGTYRVALDSNATATLTFIGIAVYFKSPLWPYAQTTQLQLDDQQPVLLDLQHKVQASGPTTDTSDVVWKIGGLSNKSHSLRISVGRGQKSAVVDMLIVTVLDSPLSHLNNTTSSSDKRLDLAPGVIGIPSNSTEGTSSSSKGSRLSSSILPVVLGTALGVIGTLVVVLVLLLCCRRSKSPTPVAWTIDDIPLQTLGSPTESPSSPDLLYTQSVLHPLRGSSHRSSVGSNSSISMANHGSIPQITVVNTDLDGYTHHQANASSNHLLENPLPRTSSLPAIGARGVASRHQHLRSHSGSSGELRSPIPTPTHALRRARRLVKPRSRLRVVTNNGEEGISSDGERPPSYTST